MRIRLVFLVSLVLLMTTGCATTPVSSSTAKPVASDRLLAFQEKTEATNATVVVTRETAQFLVKRGEVLLRTGLDGSGTLRVWSGWMVPRETTLRAGETKHLAVNRAAA